VVDLGSIASKTHCTFTFLIILPWISFNLNEAKSFEVALTQELQATFNTIGGGFPAIASLRQLNEYELFQSLTWTDNDVKLSSLEMLSMTFGFLSTPFQRWASHLFLAIFNSSQADNLRCSALTFLLVSLRKSLDVPERENIITLLKFVPKLFFLISLPIFVYAAYHRRTHSLSGTHWPENWDHCHAWFDNFSPF
jgi:hypothetical protein